ncbi:LysR family transcriptional regulator [Amycolatopsis acidiphila]|uniref:LysR family transcriptional regulator n=1 Tax=Amycolatopsis acidiphila TaxID=715473 RepID=UPI0016436FDD|nr:LysR family transcriptional regulator [Amycolatopsis acidiphila]UIJ57044.1 LysR family transcriptional regulator [Amycolatopsis acidiphila]GHG53683.1 transcriptional regulator [Amycolatopsis acidiphila]
MNLLRHLEFFVAVAEERHFGRAAARLGMAQPPLSQGVRRLEATLGVSLFDRGRGGAALTPAARDLLPRARSLLDDAAELRAAAERHARVAHRLRVGVVPAVGPRAVAGVAAAVTGCADARVEVTTGPTVTLLDRLRSEALEFAVIEHPSPLEGLVGGPVVALPMDVLLPGTHRAARRPGPVPLRLLRDLEFATGPRAAGPAAYDLLCETLDVRGYHGHTTTVHDAAAALALVASGAGFTLTADPDLGAPGVVRRPVAGDPVPLRVRVVYADPANAQARAAAIESLAERA